MLSRSLPAFAPIALLMLGSCGGASSRDTGAIVRNVVIFTVDTLRADFLSPYSDEVSNTPNYDRLAADSVLFERAYSPASLTNPALTSMLTGLQPTQHGVHVQNSGFREGIVSLPFIAQASGLSTGSFLGNMCKFQDIPHTVYHDGWDRRFCGMMDDPENYSEQYLWDESIVTAGLDWISEQERPFLAWMHLMDPHAEHHPPPRLWDYETDKPREKFEQYVYYGELEALQVPPAKEVIERLRALYRAEVAGADDQLGRVLDFFDAEGLTETTALIGGSDHGEELFETWSRYDHGLSMTEGVLWVPLMVRAPGLAPRRFESPVELAQVTPTVLELLEIDPPYEFCAPSLLAENPSRGYAFSYGSTWVTSVKTADKRYWKRHLKEAPTRVEGAWRLEAPWFTEPQLLCEYEPDSPTTPVFLPIAGENEKTAKRMIAGIEEFDRSLQKFGKGFKIDDPIILESLRRQGYIIDESDDSK